MKLAIYSVLIFAMLFGFGCLNYTKAFGVELHYEFAEETGLPAPSGVIYWLGIVTLSASSAGFGYLLGKRRRSPKQN